MICRDNCGACCIYLSISSVIPNMPHGKPAGVRCVNLSDDLCCTVYAERPKVCRDFSPSAQYCGATAHEAMENIKLIEALTR